MFVINQYNYVKTNNKVSFKSLGTAPKSLLRRNNTDKLCKECGRIARVLGEESKNIRSLLENAPQKRIAFMESLTESFNSRNFQLGNNLREDSEPVINIYKMVKNPESAHYNIVERSKMPFKTLEQIFENTNDKKDLEFVQIMQHDVLDGSKRSGEHIVGMLKSENKKLYVENPAEYKSYMKLHEVDKKAVEKLDELVNSGNFDRKKYDAKLTVREMMKNKHFREFLGQEDRRFIEDNYTEEGKNFLDKFCTEYMTPRREISGADRKDVLQMYASSTPENIGTRLELIDKYKTVDSSGVSGNSEVKMMKNLFDRIDSDKNASKFVHKALGDGIKVENMEEFNRIMDIIPPKKASVFHKNISRIVANTNLLEREKALVENVENPHFINERTAKQKAGAIRYQKKESLLSKMYKSVENIVNKKVYTNSLRSAEKEFTIDLSDAGKYSASNVYATIDIPTIESVVVKPVVVTEMPKLVATLKQNPKAKKLKVVSDVDNIIKQKLGKKTAEKQQAEYTEKATAMRLKLLPEMFNSVADTRKEQKALGIKPQVENRDVIKLYLKVQTRNKKLVNYMLKKTDADNKRVFDVKDIIQVVNSADKRIAEMKKQDSYFRAKTAKTYYDELHKSMVEQYGDLRSKGVSK